jgi:hypothetical protein
VDETNNEVIPGMTNDITTSGARTSGRAYLSTSCNEGEYDNELYSAMKLLDATISYTVDLRYYYTNSLDQKTYV